MDLERYSAKGAASETSLSVAASAESGEPGPELGLPGGTEGTGAVSVLSESDEALEAPADDDQPRLEGPSLSDRVKRTLIGPPRSLEDKSLFHRLTLIPFLAWVGLGADGLSSSCYGPDEAFRTLREHLFVDRPGRYDRAHGGGDCLGVQPHHP